MNIIKRATIFSIIFLVAAALPAQAYCLENVADPTGDAGPIQEGYELLDVPHTDIESAWVRPAFDYPAVELGVSLTSPLPVRGEHNYNAFFFFDSDGVLANNAPDGTRAGSDLAISLMYAAEGGSWATIIWYYDDATNTWNFERSDSVLFALNGPELIIHVPFEFLPRDSCFRWRVSVAASSDDSTTNGDSVPDGPGELIDCCDEEEPVVVSGVEEQQPPATPPDSTPVGGEQLLWLRILIAALFLGGGVVIAGKGPKKKPDGDNPPATPEKEDEEEKCCRTCSMFLTVGSKSDRAVRSAGNLGLGIKRDTENASTSVIPADEKCLKVAHFHDHQFKSGRRVVSDGSGSEMKIKKFSRLSKFVEIESCDKIDLWREVMIVHHGENPARVKIIMRNIRKLIPEKPVLKLVLYYCGGLRTLPKKEFEALAKDLGQRLKQIPEECKKYKKKEVEIYLSPSVDFCGTGKLRYTRLLLEQDGLKSFEKQMTLYTVDEDGNITARGNVSVSNDQLFGKTELGRIKRNPVLDATVYWDFWEEKSVCCLKLSEIKKRRALIKQHENGVIRELKKHGRTYSPPRICEKEKRAKALKAELERMKIKSLTEEEMDTAMEKKSTSEMQKYLREIRR